VDLTGLFPGPATYPEVGCMTEKALDALSSEEVKRITSPFCWSPIVSSYGAVEAGREALDDDAIDVLYVVEPDYVETGNISVYVRKISFEHMDSESLMQEYLIRSLLYNVEAEEYESLYLRLRDPAVVTDHRITETGVAAKENENRTFVLVYAFGLLTMLGVFWGGGYLMQSVVQEKESRIIEIMLSSVRPTALLSGKILAMGLLAIFQITMLVGTFLYIAARAGNVIADLGDIEIEPYKLALMLVYFVLGFLLFGSLMAAIGALSTTMRESQNFIAVVTLPATIPFFFLTLFAEEPHGTLPVVLSMIPFTAPLSMTMRIAVADVPAGEILLSLALLIGGVALAIWMAGRLFRVNTLLAGNLPGCGIFRI
jgi:ABC-2 type transport system permease protein